MEIGTEQFAAARADGAFVVDVREPAEYADGHVHGAKLIPLGTLDAATSDLPRDRPVYVVCASGNRSLRGTQALRSAGVDAHSVAGGTSAWISAGHPVVTGTHADQA